MAYTAAQIDAFSNLAMHAAANTLANITRLWKIRTKAWALEQVAAGRAAQANLLKGITGHLDGLVAASILNNRVATKDDWVLHIRLQNRVVHQFNATIGDEQTILCAGCSRFTPINGITADHIVPKSDTVALLADVVRRDGLDATQWQAYLNVNSKAAGDPDPGEMENVVVVNRSEYIDGKLLPLDTRNLDPYCNSCNTNKGTKVVMPRALAAGGWTLADTQNP